MTEYNVDSTWETLSKTRTADQTVYSTVSFSVTRNLWWLMADLIFMMRPSQFIPIWATLAAGYIYSLFFISNNLTFNAFTFNNDFWYILLSVSIGSGAVFIYNQIADIKTDQLNGKLLFLCKGLVTSTEAVWFANMLGFISLLIGYLVSTTIFFIFIICGLLGLLYSFKPTVWKNHPILSVFVNFMGGWLCFLTGSVLHHDLTTSLVVAGLPYALSWAAVFSIVTIPDRYGDHLSDKVTLSVKYGDQKTKRAAVVMIMLGLVISFFTLDPIFIFSTILALPFYFMILKKGSIEIFRPVKLSFILLVLGSGFFIPIFLLMIFTLLILTRLYYKFRFRITYPNLSSVK